MGRILCLTSGLTGLLYSSLELARRLAAAGHEVSYASEENARSAVEDLDLKFIPLPSSRLKEFQIDDSRKGTFERMGGWRRRQEEAVHALAVSDLPELIRQVGADLLLIDGEMLEHITVASSTGVPIALLNTFASIWRHPGLPPAHHRVIPGQGWKGSQIGIWLLWKNLRLSKLRRAWSQKARHLGCDRLSALRQLARKNDLDLAREADFDQWPIPFTFKRFPFISLHALEFEFRHEPLPGVHYVGPMVLKRRPMHPLSENSQALLDRLQRRRAQSPGRYRMIYAGFGSGFTTDLALVRRLITAVASRENWDLLISLGRQGRAELGDLPNNVHTFPWLPQVSVLEQSDLVVSHGGINTIDESILAGLPLLIYCGRETDMAGNAARVQHHGLGLVGSRSRDTSQSIAANLETLLSESRFRESVQRMRACYLAYTEQQIVEKVVDSLIAGQPASQISQVR